jgi:hypothetical protein
MVRTRAIEALAFCEPMESGQRVVQAPSTVCAKLAVLVVVIAIAAWARRFSFGPGVLLEQVCEVAVNLVASSPAHPDYELTIKRLFLKSRQT